MPRGMHVSVLVLALLGSPRPAVADECVTAFERWAKLSEARVRKQATVGSAQEEACLLKEEVRAELMRALGSVRRRCDAAGPEDQSAAKTKPMLDVNQSFIALLPLCRQQDQPAAGPAPKPSVAANRPCLDVRPAAEGRYALTNTRCRGKTVLAVIERKLSSGKIECRGQVVEKQLQVTAPDSAPPQLNYQCILNASDCTQERLATIFPECDW
jgi:hypothetical protein